MARKARDGYDRVRYSLAAHLSAIRREIRKSHDELNARIERLEATSTTTWHIRQDLANHCKKMDAVIQYWTDPERRRQLWKSELKDGE